MSEQQKKLKMSDIAKGIDEIFIRIVFYDSDSENLRKSLNDFKVEIAESEKRLSFFEHINGIGGGNEAKDSILFGINNGGQEEPIKTEKRVMENLLVMKKLAETAIEDYAVHIVDMTFEKFINSFGPTSRLWVQYRRSFHEFVGRVGQITPEEGVNLLTVSKTLFSKDKITKMARATSKHLEQLCRESEEERLKNKSEWLTTSYKEAKRATTSVFDYASILTPEKETMYCHQTLYSIERTSTNGMADVQSIYVGTTLPKDELDFEDASPSETMTTTTTRFQSPVQTSERLLEKRTLYYNVKPLRLQILESLSNTNDRTFYCVFIFFLQILCKEKESLDDSVLHSNVADLIVYTQMLISISCYLGLKRTTPK